MTAPLDDGQLDRLIELREAAMPGKPVFSADTAKGGAYLQTLLKLAPRLVAELQDTRRERDERITKASGRALVEEANKWMQAYDRRRRETEAAEAALAVARRENEQLRQDRDEDLQWLAEDLPKYIPALRAAFVWAERVEPHPDDRPECFAELDALITDLADGAEESKVARAALAAVSGGEPAGQEAPAQTAGAEGETP